MRVSQSIFDRREDMDAQNFGHSVGQFFKKIDRTLSFLPGKPRKAFVTAVGSCCESSFGWSCNF